MQRVVTLLGGCMVAKVEYKKYAASSKGAKVQDTQPFVFSHGFPPVPAKLVAKILRLEFVDMAELLRDDIEAERRRGAQGEGSNNSKTPRREIPDILSWIQCFGIYVSVMVSKFPGRVPNMLAYQTTLVREARRCGGGGWLAYGTAFRQQAATDALCDWSKLNSSLYPVTLMAQASGKGKCLALPRARSCWEGLCTVTTTSPGTAAEAVVTRSWPASTKCG